MSATNDGGPAFPEHRYFDSGIGAYGKTVTASDAGCGGMTLRDYFAAKAMAHIPALLAAKELNQSVENIAAWSYQVADALLAKRNKP